MDIAFYLPGRVPVYTFSLILAFGAVIGLYWTARQAPTQTRQLHFNTGIWTLAAAAISGRAAYILIHWPYFQTHLDEMPQLWLGGITGSGALPGALLALFIGAKTNHQHLGESADALLPLLTSLTVHIWFACWLIGCFYGPPTDAWWGIPAHDEWGTTATRWPLQPLLAGLSLLMAWGVDQGRARGWIQAPGLAASLELGGFALLWVGVSFIRVDPVPKAYGLPLDAWIFILLLFFALISIFWILRKREL